MPKGPKKRLGRQPLLRLLALVTRRLEQGLEERLRPLGVNVGEAWFLLALLEDGEERTTALARRLGMTFSTMTQLVDRLERAGWVLRRHDPLDRRAVRLRLSARGRRLALQVSRLLAALERRLSREISHKHRAAFERVLDGILQIIRP